MGKPRGAVRGFAHGYLPRENGTLGLGGVYNRTCACCLAGPWPACVVVGLLLEFSGIRQGEGIMVWEWGGRGRAEEEVVYAGDGGLEVSLAVCRGEAWKRCGLVVQRLASTN